ncbi:ADP-ribosyltransferase [Bacillus cereus group sp. BfR-BA-01349]|uniref:anthrax toxin lethal factor-related metalloendopeptidase n=1 Tax=Bacillus cereus group sp. BfR-BA-01349 TaxID=2920312 RepID=UPI001F585D4C
MHKQTIKNLSICIATVSLLGQYFISSTTVYAAENQINSLNLKVEQTLDFGRDKEKAKEWADTYFKDWKKTINNEQKKLLNDIKRLTQLNEKIGKFDQNSEMFSKKDKEDIDKIDKALNNKNAKLTKSLNVYKNLNGKDLGYVEGYFNVPNSPNKIDRTKYTKLVNEFKYGAINTFMNADLTQDTTNKSTPILLSLKLPKGTKIGQLNEEHIITDRNLGIEIKKTSIIVEKGREVIKLEGDVVPKTKIQEKVKKAESDLNQKFKEITGLKQNLLSLKIDNLYTSASIDRTETVIKQLVSNVPNNLLLNIMKNMNNKTLFTITDKILIPGKEGVLGYYDTISKTLFIQIDHLGHKNNEGNDTNTLLHEFGHAVDYLAKGEIQSKSSKFIEIFNRERGNITIEPYIKQDAAEFFAGVFNYLYSPKISDREQIQKEAPDACKFIRNLIHGLH